MSENNKKEEENEEEISKETLIQLLKDKSKELKTANTKLQKLEGKYVNIFKEQKSYKKDRENIVQFLENVFKPDQNKQFGKVKDIKLGEIQSQQLNKLFIQRETEKEESMNKVMQDLHLEKITMEKLFQKKLNDKTNDSDQVNQSANTVLNMQLEELEQNNLKLGKEIIELNLILKEKNSQIEKYENQDDQIRKMQTEQLINQLQQHKQNTNENQNIQKRILEAEQKSEILRLRQELENSKEKIQILEEISQQKGFDSSNFGGITPILNSNGTQGGGLQSPIMSPQMQLNQIQQIQKKVKTCSSETQTNSVLDPVSGQYVDRIVQANEQFNKKFGMQIKQDNEKTNTPQNKNNNQQQITQQQDDYYSNSQGKNGFQSYEFDDENHNFSQNIKNNQLSSEQKAKLNEEYLKNVILKYFEYHESRQHKEAVLLQSSIMTILRMTPEERLRIDNAREKGSIWKSTLSYIPFLNKQQQQEKNNNNIGERLNQSMTVDSYHAEVLQTQ